MSDKQSRELEELLLKAIQSGKQETSGLVYDVTGQIKALTKSFEAYTKDSNEWRSKMEAHIKSDMEWKEKYSPYLEGLSSVTIGGRIVVWIIAAIGTFFGALFAIKEFFK